MDYPVLVISGKPRKDVHEEENQDDRFEAYETSQKRRGTRGGAAAGQADERAVGFASAAGRGQRRQIDHAPAQEPIGGGA
jgi:hypothetical protein